jgi:hypothetical protein
MPYVFEKIQHLSGKDKLHFHRATAIFPPAKETMPPANE